MGELNEIFSEGFQESESESSASVGCTFRDLYHMKILGMKLKVLCSQKVCSSMMSTKGTTITLPQNACGSETCFSYLITRHNNLVSVIEMTQGYSMSSLFHADPLDHKSSRVQSV